ncbi:RagB/SusD family nutrient uptake outer membrane protein [Algibacter sp. AS12]|uniref:RagB/SusD family nutrient uptake outer membrane protein n=1 Tax=Algibacter sp. AS12 TaxID=3135773 RepID=UPI00398AD48E
MKQYRNITFSILLGLTLFTSCESILEVDPEEVLLADDYLGDDQLDARSALFGVLSQMQAIVAQNVVLGELRADLVNVNANTTDELREINNHEISANNSYVDFTTFYSIINNCNFALEGIDTEAYENQLLDDYASILRIRTWAQMQVLINYGKLPYITKPIRTSDELDDTYPLLNMDQALNQLIANLQEIEDVENVTKYGSSLGFSVFSMIPDQDVLLGDLYLWKGDNTMAATRYKAFLDKNLGLYNLDTNRIVVSESNGNYTYSDGWADIFDEGVSSNAVLNFVAFSEQFRQPNSSFAVIKNQLKPSLSLITNWKNQSMVYEDTPLEDYDQRAELSATINSANPQILKYQYEYFTWYRSAKVYLRYIEAINNLGHSEQALAILNGIFNNPDVEPVDAPIFNNAEGYLNFDDDFYFLYNGDDEPIFGDLGVRGRAGLAPVGLDIDLESSDAIRQVGALILNEAALELAFEGNRWEDLVRFAKTNNNPSILADAVYAKFEAAGNTAQGQTVKAKLMDESNWFLPLAIPNNFIEE